jgi:hypothetical protein
MTRSMLRTVSSAWHVRLYAGVWAGYFGLLLALPIRYGRLEALTAAASLLGWVALSLLCAWLTHRWLMRRGLTFAQMRLSEAQRAVTLRDLRMVVMTSLALSVLGFACLFIDRLFIQHIDYSQGIVVARELWRKAGEQREGVSSPLSVLGYLFGFSFFVATTVAHLHWELLTKADRRVVLALAVILIAANSLLTGGRSIVLVQLAAIAAVGALRKNLGLSFLPGRGVRTFATALVAMVIAVGYSLYVFSERAAVGNALPAIYVDGMIGHLGGETTQGFSDLERLPIAVGSVAEFGTLAGAYLTHSFGTFESALEFEQRPGTISFAFVRELMYKSGLLQQDDEGWPLEGRFMPLPGELWYDFGWMGFLLGAVVVGALVGGAPALASLFGGGVFAIGMGEFALLTGFLAPLLLSIDILSVPFMILGFLQLDVIARLAGGSRCWWVAGRRVTLRALPT